MQTLSNTLTASVSKDTEQEKASNWFLFISVSALILCGSLTYAIYPPPVNAAALALMVGLFYYTLQKHDPVSFFIQLFIGNFFIFGNKFGGNYNIAAFVSIVFYTAINGKMPFLKTSAFDRPIKSALVIWCVFDLLSVVGGNLFPFAVEMQNFFAFFMMVYLMYFISRISFTENDIYRFLIAVSIFSGYEFLVALNQRYEFFSSPFPFFPSNDRTIEFYDDIIRSFSTLNNYEAFAEFCVSLITLLIPGLLTGNTLKKSRFFYYLSIASILLSCVSIVFSGTRSSMLLLPFAIIIIGALLGKKLKTKIVVSLVVGITILFIANSAFKVIDLSVFQERSEDVDVGNLTMQQILNGDAINRGGLFPYAMQQVKKTGIIGRGYFVSSLEYQAVHFNKDDLGVADYHNLYMSAYVMFGAVGFLSMMFVIFYAIVSGWRTYWMVRKRNDFLVDILLGCNVLFLFFMINQFKIQMERDINYFSLMMFLLTLYISLTVIVRKTVFAKELIEQ